METEEQDTDGIRGIITVSPPPRKPKSSNKINYRKGSPNFCPFNSETRVLSHRNIPVAFHHTFSFKSTTAPNNKIYKHQIAPLRPIKNSGEGLRKAVFQHNPIRRQKALYQKLKKILKNPLDTKQPKQKAVRESPNNNKATPVKATKFDKIIESHLAKKSKETTINGHSKSQRNHGRVPQAQI